MQRPRHLLRDARKRRRLTRGRTSSEQWCRCCWLQRLETVGLCHKCSLTLCYHLTVYGPIQEGGILCGTAGVSCGLVAEGAQVQYLGAVIWVHPASANNILQPCQMYRPTPQTYRTCEGPNHARYELSSKLLVSPNNPHTSPLHDAPCKTPQGV